MVRVTGAVTPESPETPVVPAWVYRLDVNPPARHDGWRRAIRILRLRRQAPSQRRAPGPRRAASLRRRSG